jgi:hypothetical protein
MSDCDGPEIVATLEGTFRRYLALDPGLPFVLALWTLATHVFECFDAFPYIAITSPTKRCGKTRLAEIVELLSANGFRTVSASPAAIFRSIQAHTLEKETITLIIDEAEALGTKSETVETVREILNAGYRRGQYVLRCEKSGEKYEPTRFSTYCPKVIVLIGVLQDTIADRCIPIRMRRRKTGEEIERFFYTRALSGARRTRKQISEWAKANLERVKRRYRGRDITFLEDREAELWMPLFAVCVVAAPERFDSLKALALGISRGKHSEEPAELGILLLRDIRDMFNLGREDRISSSKLLLDLTTVEESPWASWSNGRGLDARSLARMLRPFKIEPHNLRMQDNTVVKGYERGDFEEAWTAYLPPVPAATPLQPASAQWIEPIDDPLRQSAVADAKTQESQQ